jgi:phosphate transport system permease protein
VGEPSADYRGDALRPRAARSLKSRRSTSDLLFRSVLRSGGSIALLIMIGVGSFPTYNAWDALHKAGLSFLTTQAWNANGGQFGIAAVVIGTALIAVVALTVAMAGRRPRPAPSRRGQRCRSASSGRTRPSPAR